MSLFSTIKGASLRAIIVRYAGAMAEHPSRRGTRLDLQRFPAEIEWGLRWIHKFAELNIEASNGAVWPRTPPLQAVVAGALDLGLSELRRREWPRMRVAELVRAGRFEKLKDRLRFDWCASGLNPSPSRFRVTVPQVAEVKLMGMLAEDSELHGAELSTWATAAFVAAVAADDRAPDPLLTDSGWSFGQRAQDALGRFHTYALSHAGIRTDTYALPTQEQEEKG